MQPLFLTHNPILQLYHLATFDNLQNQSSSRLGYVLSSLALRSMSEKLDPRVHNCGILMGLNSLVVKCHGESEFKGVSYAADIIHSLITNNVNNKIEDYLRKMKDSLNN